MAAENGFFGPTQPGHQICMRGDLSLSAMTKRRKACKSPHTSSLDLGFTTDARMIFSLVLTPLSITEATK